MTITENEAANNKYNEKVLSTSAWIDKEFLSDVLGTTLGENVKVVNYTVEAAVGVGDNYFSILYRTKVDYNSESNDDTRTKHLMIKGIPKAKILLDMVEEMGIFIKEIGMYTSCLPAMEKLFQETFPGATFVAPSAYACSRENTLVMEDLKENGYKMADRQKQLNFEHCKVTLEAIARFHALSVNVDRDNPEIINQVTSGEIYSETNRVKMEPFMGPCFRDMAGSFEKDPELSRFSKLIREVGEFCWDSTVAVIQPSNNFNVLNHGDTWVNNIMYKFNEDGTIHSAKLIDFQLSRYTTPAVDLLYFFFSSVQPDVLKARMMDLVEIYHKAFTSDMVDLGLDFNYSLEDLHEDLRGRSFYALLVMAQILPLFMAQPADVLDLETINLEVIKPEDDSPMLKNYYYPHYKYVAGSLLKHLESIGYLEEIQKRMQPIAEAVRARQAAAETEKKEES